MCQTEGAPTKGRALPPAARAGALEVPYIGALSRVTPLGAVAAADTGPLPQDTHFLEPL